jgi:hypothetical protein
MTFDLERRDREDGLATQSPLTESRRSVFTRPAKLPATAAGLKVERRFTASGGTVMDPYSTVEWERRTTRITNPDGSVVFEMKDIEIPRSWSRSRATS